MKKNLGNLGRGPIWRRPVKIKERRVREGGTIKEIGFKFETT